MPYTHKKVGDKYIVYKAGKKVGETKGTKVALDKYLAALHINADKGAKKETKKEAKSLKESVMEGPMLGAEHPGCEDNVGAIYIVLKPSPETSHEDLVHQTHAFGMGQYDPAGIHGVYNNEDEANIVAENATKGLHKHLDEVEKKKDMVLGKLGGHMKRLEKEVSQHMKDAASRPDESEHHHQLAETKMAMMKSLRDKHKIVKASKKEYPHQKKELKENSPAPSKPRENPGPAVAPGKPGQKPGPRRPLGNPDVKPKPKASISENENNIVSKIVQRYNTLKKARNNG